MLDAPGSLKALRFYYRELINEAGGDFSTSGPSYLTGRWSVPGHLSWHDEDVAVFVDFPVRSGYSLRLWSRGIGSVDLLAMVLPELKNAVLKVQNPLQEFEPTYKKTLTEFLHHFQDLDPSKKTQIFDKTRKRR